MIPNVVLKKKTRFKLIFSDKAKFDIVKSVKIVVNNYAFTFV